VETSLSLSPTSLPMNIFPCIHSTLQQPRTWYRKVRLCPFSSHATLKLSVSSWSAVGVSNHHDKRHASVL
jgi:hypothetical protein